MGLQLVDDHDYDFSMDDYFAFCLRYLMIVNCVDGLHRLIWQVSIGLVIFIDFLIV